MQGEKMLVHATKVNWSHCTVRVGGNLDLKEFATQFVVATLAQNRSQRIFTKFAGWA
jgi:hypothetical protein